MSKLFSTTPDFKKTKHRLHIVLLANAYPLGFLLITRLVIFALVVLTFQNNLVWYLLITLVLSFVVWDILRWRAAQVTVFGFDGEFFIVDKRDLRKSLVLSGEVVVNSWLVALTLKEPGSRGRYPMMLGEWNLSPKDFHALRQFLVH